MSVIDCEYNSVWDGGFVVTTAAKVDTVSGEISEIASAEPENDDGESLETLDREYLTVPGVAGEFEIVTADAGYACADVGLLQAALPASPRLG